MARTQTMVQLSDQLLDELDREADRRGVSRSALIREAIDGLLAAQRRDEVGRMIVDGYRRIPPGTPDEWGDLDALGDTSTDELMARLDKEERDAGHPPW